jgi:rubrerythrin
MSINSTAAPAGELPNWEEFKKAMDKLRELTKGMVQAILITKLAPEEGVWKCKYQDKTYLLIRQEEWDRFRKDYVVTKDAQPHLRSLSSIPVLKDDKLAVKVVLANMIWECPQCRHKITGIQIHSAWMDYGCPECGVPFAKFQLVRQGETDAS